MTPASPSRLLAGAALNLVFSCIFVALVWPAALTLWSALTDLPVASPMVGFMSEYRPPERNGYWLFVTLVFGGYLLLSAALVPLLGASPGKALAGVRYVDADGRPAGIMAAVKRAAVTLMLLALTLLPGPILGFVFGKAADPWSLTALGAGLLVAGLIGNLRRDGRVLAYRVAGIWPVLRRAA